MTVKGVFAYIILIICNYCVICNVVNDVQGEMLLYRCFETPWVSRKYFQLQIIGSNEPSICCKWFAHHFTNRCKSNSLICKTLLLIEHIPWFHLPLRINVIKLSEFFRAFRVLMDWCFFILEARTTWLEVNSFWDDVLEQFRRFCSFECAQVSSSVLRVSAGCDLEIRLALFHSLFLMKMLPSN